MTNQIETPKNMRTFYIIWVGQFISMVGSGLTSFGLGVWTYVETGKATPFALIALFYNLPRILISPFAGSVADRYNRRHIMILADTGSGVLTLISALLLFSGNLQIWHIYIIASISSIFAAFQEPAYMASITMLVPKDQLGRAGGIQQMAQAAERLLTPVLAGALFATIGLWGVMIIDFVTFFFAIGALLLVHIPQPPRTTEVAEEGEKDSMLRDALFGWKYLRQRPGLFSLLLYFAVVNFFLSLSGVLSGPLILSFAGPTEMGLVQMAGGVGMLIGGITMGAWGGPKTKRVWGLIAAIGLSGFGYFMLGMRPSVPLIATGMVIFMFFIPMAAALSQALWQTKVAPDVQGRVFAIRSMISWSIIPFSNLIAGPLADQVFEPLLLPGGALSNTFVASLVGVGPGRGIGLIFMVSASFLWLSSLYAFSKPRLRNLEQEIPDAIPDDPEPSEKPSEELEDEAQPEQVPATG